MEKTKRAHTCTRKEQKKVVNVNKVTMYLKEVTKIDNFDFILHVLNFVSLALHSILSVYIMLMNLLLSAYERKRRMNIIWLNRGFTMMILNFVLSERDVNFFSYHSPFLND